MSFRVPVPDAKTRAWPLTVDGEALEKILPQLEKAEQERMLQEEKARAEEKERLKKRGARGNDSTSLTRGP